MRVALSSGSFFVLLVKDDFIEQLQCGHGVHVPYDRMTFREQRAQFHLQPDEEVRDLAG